MTTLRAAWARAVCRMRGHRWSPWSYYRIRMHVFDPLIESGWDRFCFRCSEAQYRGVEWRPYPVSDVPSVEPWT